MKNKQRKEYLSQFYRKNHIVFIIAFFVDICTVALNFGITWIMQQLLDAVYQVPGALSLVKLGLMTAAIILLIVLFKQATYWTKPRFMQRAMLQYKNHAFHKLTKKSISAFQQEETAGYLSAFSNDMNTVETDYLETQFSIATYIVELSGAIVMMLYYSPIMTLIAIAFCLLPIVVSLLNGNHMANAEKRVSEANAGVMASLKDCLSGFSVMKSFKAEQEIAKIVCESNEQAENAKCRKRKLSTLLYMAGAVAAVTAQLGTFLVGCMMAQAGYPITPGKLIAFMDLTGLFIEAVRELPVLLGKHKAARALVDKLAETLEKNVQDRGKEIPAKLDQGITVSNLKFAYEAGKPILKNVSCTFESGKSYAIVGASGSGKSTLLNLLMGSYPYQGEILYDGQQLRQVSAKSLYDLVSIIQQNVFVFNASIRENIMMFKSFPKEKVDEAIVRAGLSSLVAEKGEHYLCGENGSNLSGGEKQRISIARSLLHNCCVLLVDEATAALDKETAYQVSSAILDVSGLTKIVVTHTLDAALLSRYDGILTMKAGEIIESGTFHELMQQKGYFYSLYTVAQE